MKLKEIVELAQGSILTRKAAPDLEISYQAGLVPVRRLHQKQVMPG